MERYDEIESLLNSTHGMSFERAAKIKADNTVMVLVGPHGDEMAELAAITLNDDGSEKYDISELQALIGGYFPSSIATMAEWKARRAYVIGMGNE